MTQAQAQAYFPTNFLERRPFAALSTTPNWIPTAALAAGSMRLCPAGTSATVAGWNQRDAF